MHKKGDAKMPVVRIVNPKPYDWRGTQCFIDGNKVPRVKSVTSLNSPVRSPRLSTALLIISTGI